jgi:hypothetical protein
VAFGCTLRVVEEPKPSWTSFWLWALGLLAFFVAVGVYGYYYS